MLYILFVVFVSCFEYSQVFSQEREARMQTEMWFIHGQCTKVHSLHARELGVDMRSG